jgi:CHASE3 domain sensor protein
MNKKLILVMGAIILLTIGAVFVTAQTQNDSAKETVEIKTTTQTIKTCSETCDASNSCGGNCAGTCGVSQCGCRK